jgi:hypothetical protein
MALSFKCSLMIMYRLTFMRNMQNLKLFDIERLKLIEGELPSRALELVLDWAVLHRSELLENWELCQSKILPKKIKPLK